jgi:LPXTG-motif cell wall-anchored protein
MTHPAEESDRHEIINYPAFALPFTGTKGSLFYIIGVVLVVLGGLKFLHDRKKAANEPDDTE